MSLVATFTLPIAESMKELHVHNVIARCALFDSSRRMTGATGSC